MKEILRQLVSDAGAPIAGRHIAREYLQARILGAMQAAGAFNTLAFHGGTALRFLYGIPRFSEDLDFALEGDRDRYDFRGILKEVERQLKAETYAVDIRLKQERTVNSAFIRLPGLPYEMGLSPHANEVLAVKIEVDTDPPGGAVLETSLVQRYVLLRLMHHDRASLLAGKLHAVLQREYVKGRDLYDLTWYLANPDWPEPNLGMLNAALVQTGWGGDPLAADTWRAAAWERLARIDWAEAARDVAPFLMTPGEAALLTREGMKRLLRVE